MGDELTSSGSFLETLATALRLSADTVTVADPTPAPPGSDWTPLATARFGAPPEGISESDFIAAVLAALRSESGQAVEVVSSVFLKDLPKSFKKRG